jgi:hypothetical protein
VCLLWGLILHSRSVAVVGMAVVGVDSTAAAVEDFTAVAAAFTAEVVGSTAAAVEDFTAVAAAFTAEDMAVRVVARAAGSVVDNADTAAHEVADTVVPAVLAGHTAAAAVSAALMVVVDSADARAALSIRGRDTRTAVRAWRMDAGTVSAAHLVAVVRRRHAVASGLHRAAVLAQAAERLMDAWAATSIPGPAMRIAVRE